MKKRNLVRMVTIPNGDYHGVYELADTIESVPNDSIHRKPMCKCCNQPMVAAFDVMQLGFWQDHYRTFFVCKPCMKALEYSYDLSRIEPVKRKGKKS